MEDLILQILGSLDIEKTADNINTQLKSLSGKLDNLKLSFGIDKEILNVFRDFTKSMENIKAMIEELNKVTKTEIEITKQQDGTIQTIQKDYLKSGEIIEKTTTQINKQTEAIDRNIEALGKQEETLNNIMKIKEKYKIDSNGATLESLTKTIDTDAGKLTITTTPKSNISTIISEVDYQKQVNFAHTLQQELERLHNQSIDLLNSIKNPEAQAFLVDMQYEYEKIANELSQFYNKKRILTKEDKQRFSDYVKYYKEQLNEIIKSEKQLEIEEEKHIAWQEKQVAFLESQISKFSSTVSHTPIDKASDEYQRIVNTINEINQQIGLYKNNEDILTNEVLKNIQNRIVALRQEYEQLLQTEREQTRLMSYGTKMNIPYMGLDDNAIKRYAQSIYGVETEIRNLSKIMEDGDSRIRTFVARIKEADGTFREMKVTVDEATQSLYHGIEQTGNLAGKDIGLIGALKVAFERFPVWLVASTAVMGAVHQIRDAVTEVQELNKAQTNIQMITGATAQQTQEWTKQLSNLSTQLHDTTLNVMQASEEFLRAGRGIEETQKLIEASTVMSKISGQTQEETAQQLIAIQNAYKMSAQQMMDVVDKLTTVDNATSTSTKELGIALEHTAATAQQAGVSFDKLVSYIATVSSVTRRSASTIGDSMRSIFARIESIREGKQFDPEGNPLNNVEKALNRVGIALRDTSNSFRNISDVFDELAAKWNKLNDVEKNEIATAIAGVYQRENFLTLMQHYNEALDLQAKMTDSAGSALKRYDAYTQSIEAHLNDLTNAGQRLWMDALNSETINNFISILTGLVNLLDAAVKEFGLLPPAISATSVAFFAFNKELRDTISTGVVNFFVNLKNSLSGVTVAAEEATAAIETTNAVTKGLSVGSILATLGGGIVAGIAGFAIGELIQYIINSAEKAKREAEAFEKQNDEMVQAYRNNANAIDTLVAKYEELSQKTTLNNDEQGQLIVIQNELNKLMPNLAEKIDEQGNAHLRNTDAIREELEYTKQLIELQNREKIANFRKDLSEVLNEANKIQNKIKELERYKNMSSNIPFGIMIKAELPPPTPEELIRTERELLEQRHKLIEVQNKIVDVVRDNINAYIQLSDVKEVLTDTDKKYINNLIEQNQNTIKNVTTGKQFYDSLTKQIDGIIAVRIALSQMSNEANNNTAIIKKATDILRQHGMSADAVSQYIAILTDTVGQLTDSANNELQNIALLTDAINKLRNGYSLTQEDIAKLVVKYPDLIDKYTEENGIIKINIQALEDKRKAEISAFNTTIQALEGEIETRKRYLATVLPLYEKEIMAIKDVASAQQIANNIKNDAILDMARKSGSIYLGGKLGDIYGSFSDSFVQIGQALEDLNNLKGSLNSVGSGLKDITKNLNDGYIPAADKASKATKSAAESVQPYVIDEFSHKLTELDLQLEQSKARLESYDKTSQEYRNELQAQNVLLEQKKVLVRNEINSLTSANNALLNQINVLKQHNKLTTEQQKQLNDLLKEYDDNLKKIEEYNKSIIDLDSNIQRNTKDIYQAWLDNATNIANQVVEAYKAALQKERDLALRAKDDELKAEEERHKTVMDSLDKELKQYEDIINAKLKLIDMESNERDYNSQLSDLEQQRADIQKQINVLSLDDSVEAQAKLADLKQKEADIEKKIDDLKYKHAQDLRKQNLQNELDSYKQQIDAKKQAENDMYQANKDRIDREKQLIEAHYEDLLNDTQKFENMRQQIIAGNIQQISEILRNYLDTFNKLMHDSIQQNGEDLLGLLGLIQQIQVAQTGLGSLGVPPSGTFTSKGTTYNFGGSSQQQTPLAVISPAQYKIDSTGSAIMSSRALASVLGKSADWDAQSGMVIIGDKKFIPSLIDANGTSYLPIRVVAAAFGHRVEYDKLTGKITVFDTGGYTGKFDGGKLAILHEKELVLNKEDTFNILKVVDITRNMIKSLETLKLPPLSLVGAGNVFNVDIHIDKVEGNENGANVLLHEFMNGLRKKGVRLA